jgi:outer membrane protein assembly factor BamB
MKREDSTLPLILTSLALSANCCLWAQDWPQWRGPNRDAKASGFKAPKSWPKELTQKWKTNVGSGDATPALVGDKLYVFGREGNKETIRCLNAATGKEVWQEQYETPAVSGPDASVHSGPRSSPTVADGKVVTLGVCGTLSCLDAATGKLLWRKTDFPDQWPRFHTATSPLVVGGQCITQLGKESEGAIVAYDLATGEQRWKWTSEGPGYASPVLLTLGGTKMIVTLTAKSIVGINATDGKLLWQTPFVAQGMNYNAATPIVDGETIVVSGAGRGTKAFKIEKQGDAFAATELWSNPDIAVQFNTPVLKNDLLFGVSARDVLFCLNSKTGATVWTAPASGRRGFGSVVDAGPVLVSLTPTCQLAVFEPSDKEFKQIATYKVAEADTYAYPIISGSSVFIKDKDSVALWSLN